MASKFYQMMAGLVFLGIFTGPARAGERLAVSTHVTAAARLPVLERLPATNRLELAIALPVRDRDILTNLIQQVYDRHSTNFHQFLTPAQFAARFGPTKEDYQRVMDFAVSNRLEVVHTYANRALVDVAGRVADIEQAFQVQMGIYQHPIENRRFYAPDVSPTVAAGLPVLCISGMDNYWLPQPQGRAIPPVHGQNYTNYGSSLNISGFGTIYGSADLRTAYVPGTNLKGAGQVVGLLEFGGYVTADIKAYEATNGLPDVPLNNVLNTFSGNNGDFEVALDIEMSMAMAPGLDVINVYEATNFDSGLAEMATPSRGERLPYQMSSSVGMQGDASVEQSFLEFAVQGQSFFAASGDYGALVIGDTTHAEDYANYMIYVGGTRLFMSGAGTAWTNETVWDDPPPTNFNYFASTGGILTNVPIPEYQQSVSMAGNMGSTQHRNIPDVAMAARDVFMISTSSNTNYSQPLSAVGTSAASPMWAGLMALINEQAVDEGKPPVGFLLPALAEVGEESAYTNCFHDITTGSNAWFDPFAMTGSSNKYYATNGYDLCTGWGSPNGMNFINAVVALAGPVFVNFNYTGALPANESGTILYPWKTLAQGTNAVSPGGTIIIINGGSSAATSSITKPMTITAQNGGATIIN